MVKTECSINSSDSVRSNSTCSKVFKVYRYNIEVKVEYTVYLEVINIPGEKPVVEFSQDMFYRGDLKLQLK